MVRMNTRGSKPRNMANTPVNTTTGRAFTAEGGMGWQRTPKGELFLAAVPALKGSTLVLLDRSGSMSGILSAKSSLTCQDTANVFAAALAL